MQSKELLFCSLSSWYPLFKDLTFQSAVIPLGQEFLDYLGEDGVALPEPVQQPDRNDMDRYDYDSDEWENEDEAALCSFPDLQEKILMTIKSFGGEAFPKFTWSSPKDAVWLTFGSTLKCTSPAEVFLLLKGSDFVSHDLDHAMGLCEDVPSGPTSHYLTLRKWESMDLSLEFRCFVRDGHLLAVSQRHAGVFYPFLPKDKDRLQEQACTFMNNVVIPRLQSRISRCVCDVYLPRGRQAVLVDINPYATHTDPILFSWEELHAMRGGSPGTLVPFRVVESAGCVKHTPSSAHNRFPKDLYDLSTVGTDDVSELLEQAAAMQGRT